MKKSILFVSLIAFSVQLFAWVPDIPAPTLSSGCFRIVGANVQNYLSDFEAQNASCSSQEAFDTKTENMATVFVHLKADIVALCEVQQDDEILSYLVDAMNNLYGKNVYDYVLDGTHYNNPAAGSYGAIKCGYIYRFDKFKEGKRSSTNPSDATFKNRMQVIDFTEKATNEKFILSLNHLQAKNSDPSGAKRSSQATTLVTALLKDFGDPDILIVGDLNAETDEACIQTIIDAGYEEQLVRFDPTAYSYVYYGSKQLIDHALANNSMAEQVKAATPYHFNTSYSSRRFSDHDCIVVDVKLGDGSAIDYVAPDSEAPARQMIYRNGQLFIQVNEHLFDLTGRRVE